MKSKVSIDILQNLQDLKNIIRLEIREECGHHFNQLIEFKN